MAYGTLMFQGRLGGLERRMARWGSEHTLLSLILAGAGWIGTFFTFTFLWMHRPW